MATSLPRETNDTSILLLTDEHGKSDLDDTPLRAQAIFELLQLGLLYSLSHFIRRMRNGSSGNMPELGRIVGF